MEDRAKEVERKLEEISHTASQIGGSIHGEAGVLHRDVTLFLQNRHDRKRIAAMKKHAARLEHETKEI